MKKMNKKGFTLIELLAVIVILGLLMAIAIPSVTKYITQSRKKTLTNTISNYMSALTSEVNNMEYTFTANDTVYAVPIECIAVERGGTDPFGYWYPAHSATGANAYWAYVLVQYDDNTSSYTYGFTFKDSAGYSLLPTASTKLSEGGSQIVTNNTFKLAPNTKLATVTDGALVAGTTAKAVADATGAWTGFKVTDSTKLVVLQGDDTSTNKVDPTKCLIAQK